MTTLYGRPVGAVVGAKADTATFDPGDWTAITAADLAPNGTLQPAGDFVFVEVYHTAASGVLHVLTREQDGAADQDGAWLLGPGEGKRFDLHGLQEATISIRATVADVTYRIEAGTLEGTP